MRAEAIPSWVFEWIQIVELSFEPKMNNEAIASSTSSIWNLRNVQKQKL